MCPLECLRRNCRGPEHGRFAACSEFFGGAWESGAQLARLGMEQTFPGSRAIRKLALTSGRARQWPRCSFR